MKVGVVGAVAVAVDLVEAVVEVMDQIEIHPTMIIHSAATMVSLVVTDPRKKKILGDHLKGVVGLMVDSAVVIVVVLAMKNMARVNALVGYSSVVVELDVGKQYLQAVVHVHLRSAMQFICADCLLCFRNEMKRDGSGRGNWGAPADEVAV